MGDGRVHKTGMGLGEDCPGFGKVVGGHFVVNEDVLELLVGFVALCPLGPSLGAPEGCRAVVL